MASRPSWEALFEPVSALAMDMDSLSEEHRENCEILAYRADVPGGVYRLPLVIASSVSLLRERGLQLLWARIVSVAAGILGASRLQLICAADETFEFVRVRFDEHPGLMRMLEGFGPFSFTRAEPMMTVVEGPSSLPYPEVASSASSVQGAEAGPTIYIGVDFGRSDVKTACVDEKGVVLATHETKWWRPSGSGEREYLDPAKLESAEQHLNVLVSAARDCLAEVPGSESYLICGLGLSAAGIIVDGKISGVPPAFGGVDAAAARPILERLDCCIVDALRDGGAKVSCSTGTVTVNDGNAIALNAIGDTGGGELFLSLGTGLAGGFVHSGDICGGVLELGKVVIAVKKGDAEIPKHDMLGVEGCAQSLAGTQRSVFNALARYGGEIVTDKAQQRQKLIELQQSFDDEAVTIFEELGDWLAYFVTEFRVYMDRSVDRVEVCGKVADGRLGKILLERAGERLAMRSPTSSVQQCEDSVFGQAVGVANAVRPK